MGEFSNGRKGAVFDMEAIRKNQEARKKNKGPRPTSHDAYKASQDRKQARTLESTRSRLLVENSLIKGNEAGYKSKSGY